MDNFLARNMMTTNDYDSFTLRSNSISPAQTGSPSPATAATTDNDNGRLGSNEPADLMRTGKKASRNTRNTKQQGPFFCRWFGCTCHSYPFMTGDDIWQHIQDKHINSHPTLTTAAGPAIPGYECMWFNCNEMRPSLFRLKSHMKRHLEWRPFGCEHCDEHFKHRGDQRKHYQRKHPDATVPPLCRPASVASTVAPCSAHPAVALKPDHSAAVALTPTHSGGTLGLYETPSPAPFVIGSHAPAEMSAASHLMPHSHPASVGAYPSTLPVHLAEAMLATSMPNHPSMQAMALTSMSPNLVHPMPAHPAPAGFGYFPVSAGFDAAHPLALHAYTPAPSPPGVPLPFFAPHAPVSHSDTSRSPYCVPGFTPDQQGNFPFM